jgi:hypothetical protein
MSKSHPCAYHPAGLGFWHSTTGAMYVETIGATEDRFLNSHLAIGCCNQLKSLTQGDSESLHEFATTIKQFTHRVFPVLHEDHIRRGPGKAFVDGIRDWGINWQLLLKAKKTLKEALIQTLELDIVKLAVRSSIRLQKTSDRASWRNRPAPKRKMRLLAAYMPAL